jgi:ornithine decarboxylase
LVALDTLRKFIQRSPNKGAFYTLSRGRFLQQHKLWKESLPHVTPYYAVKCNPDPNLLQWMYEARDIGFDCASAREMHLVKDKFYNLHTQDILFANPCKTPNDILVAKGLKIPWVTADSSEELEKMDQAGYRPDVLLRVAVDDSSSACPFGAKFGLQPSNVLEVARVAKKVNIPIVGLSFHVGSGCQSPDAFRQAIHTSKIIWKDLYRNHTVQHFKTLDIGGGWSSDPAVFRKQVQATKRGMIAGIQPGGYIAEPGRFYAAPTHDLYVKVVGKKPKQGGGWRYTIDESIYGQFSCIPFDHCEPKIYRIQLHKNESTSIQSKTPSTIFGRTCDSLDWICNGKTMQELNVGDWLYIPNMGAYTTATSTEFNGFPKPEFFLTDERPKKADIEELETLSFPLSKMLSVKLASN